MSVAALVFWDLAWLELAQPFKLIGHDLTEATASTACIIATPLTRDVYILSDWKPLVSSAGQLFIHQVSNWLCWNLIGCHKFKAWAKNYVRFTAGEGKEAWSRDKTSPFHKGVVVSHIQDYHLLHWLWLHTEDHNYQATTSFTYITASCEVLWLKLKVEL